MAQTALRIPQMLEFQRFLEGLSLFARANTFLGRQENRTDKPCRAAQQHLAPARQPIRPKNAFFFKKGLYAQPAFQTVCIPLQSKCCQLKISTTAFGNGVVQHNPGGYRIIRPKGKLGKIIRRYDPGVFLDLYHDASRARFQSARLDIFPVFIIFQDNSLLDMTYHPTWESFFFEPLGFQVAPGDYFFHRFEIRYRTDASKKLSADLKYYGGEYYDGGLDEWSASLRVAPSPKIALTGSYELNRTRDLGIERTTTDIAIYTAGLRLAHNPRLQASLFYQYKRP